MVPTLLAPVALGQCMTSGHGGRREGAGKPKGSVTQGTKGLAARTKRLLGDLYGNVHMQPPLVLLWQAANDLLMDRNGEYINLDPELRIKAMVAAAPYSHTRAAGNDQGDVPNINYVIRFGDRIPLETQEAIIAKFSNITAQAYLPPPEDIDE